MKQLCIEAGVKFDAHYSVTSVDPPELVRYIKEKHPDVSFDIPHDKDGKPVTMWSLIAKHTLPPTRVVRYCCEELKECNGVGRVTVTGVRWAESARRKNTHGVVDFTTKPKGSQKIANALGADYKLNKSGHVILNDDNDEERRMVEQCYRTRKTLVNPIVDWLDEDVWDYIHDRNLPYCSLYDEGFTRLGCIGCPLTGTTGMEKDFARWPMYKKLYIKAFQKMADNHPDKVKVLQDTFNPDVEEQSVIAREREREREYQCAGRHSPLCSLASDGGEMIMSWWLHPELFKKVKHDDS